jgi:hypothetical protein
MTNDILKFNTLSDTLKKDKKEWPSDLEDIILKRGDVTALLLWAVQGKQSRCEKVEKELCKSTSLTFAVLTYFKHFPNATDGVLYDTVKKDPLLSLRYAQLISKGRFIDGEVSILKSPLRDVYIRFLEKVKINTDGLNLGGSN